MIEIGSVCLLNIVAIGLALFVVWVFFTLNYWR
jgi:hypothetical protein